MNTFFCGLFCLSLSPYLGAGEVYSQEKLRGLAVAFIDTYEDHVVNSSTETDTEMLVLSGEFKGYVGAYLDAAQRGANVQDNVIAQCLFNNTFEEVALNTSYLLVEMEPMSELGAIENVGLAVRAFCGGRLAQELAPASIR